MGQALLIDEGDATPRYVGRRTKCSNCRTGFRRKEFVEVGPRVIFHARQVGWGDEAVGCPLAYEIKHKREVDTTTAYFYGSRRAPRRRRK